VNKMIENRLKTLQARLDRYGFDCVAILPGASMQYFTELNFHLMERPIIAFFSQEGPPTLLAPAFEIAKLEGLNHPFNWQLFPWTDEAGVEGAFEACCQALNLNQKRLGVESLVMRVREHDLLKQYAPQISLAPADDLIASLRAVKDAAEVAHMQAAIALAETALEATLPKIKIGMTEKAVAAQLLIGLLEAGSDSLPFEPLVQTGLTGAAPHATAGRRKLAEGDLLIIDFGARVAGYASDITRTFAVGQLNAESQRMYETVKAANAAGRAAIRPGVTAESVDAAARAVIEEAGLGAYFTHRTGHGLGLDGHEPPYIVAGNQTRLQAGMTFTVEPGVYIHGVGGVRIEDDVIVTEAGGRSLSTFSRELQVVG
jgi:Xaa-Pro dipeptidase